MERVMGIEPTSSAWKAEVLPLNYTRLDSFAISLNLTLTNSKFRRAPDTLITLFRRAKILTVFSFQTVRMSYCPVLNLARLVSV